MSDAFDGAGKRHREPSFWVGIILVLLVVLAVAGIALAASGALHQTDVPGTTTHTTEPE